MPVFHKIDNENRLIITRWQGEPTVSEMVDALLAYHAKIKSKPEFLDYDELLDFSETDGIHIDSISLKRLGEIAVSFDRPSFRIKLAIVAKSTLGYGLARMYEIARGINSKATKEVNVFREESEALKWLMAKKIA